MGFFSRNNDKALDKLNAIKAKAQETINKYADRNKKIEEIDKLKEETSSLKKEARRAKYKGMAKFADKASKISKKTAIALAKGGKQLSKYASETQIGKGKIDILGEIKLPTVDNQSSSSQILPSFPPPSKSSSIFGSGEDIFSQEKKKKVRKTKTRTGGKTITIKME